MANKKNKDHQKDKFDENIEREGMGPVDNENVSEETGFNKGKRNDRTSSGEGIEEFIQNDPEFEDGDDDENE